MTSMIGTLVFAAVMVTATGNLFLGGDLTTAPSANQPVFNVANIGHDPASSSNMAGISSVLSSLGGSQSGMSMDNPSLGGLGGSGLGGGSLGGNTLSSSNNMGRNDNWGNNQVRYQQRQRGYNRNFGRSAQQNPLLWWWFGNQMW